MYIKVKVLPNSKKEKFTQISSEQFEISVKEPTKMNLANQRVRELFAQYFGVKRNDIRIISGHRSPSKILSINNLPEK